MSCPFLGKCTFMGLATREEKPSLRITWDVAQITIHHSLSQIIIIRTSEHVWEKDKISAFPSHLYTSSSLLVAIHLFVRASPLKLVTKRFLCFWKIILSIPFLNETLVRHSADHLILFKRELKGINAGPGCSVELNFFGGGGGNRTPWYHFITVTSTHYYFMPQDGNHNIRHIIPSASI